MAKKRYCYYQPNEKDIKNRFGDCTVRALSKAFNCSWIDAYMKMVPFCIEYQTPNIFNLPLKLEREVMAKLGFTYCGVSVKRGSKRPTVDSFARDHDHGTFILNVANHVVACVDGVFYDTWDSGACSLYGWYEKTN